MKTTYAYTLALRGEQTFSQQRSASTGPKSAGDPDSVLGPVGERIENAILHGSVGKLSRHRAKLAFRSDPLLDTGFPGTSDEAQWVSVRGD